MKLSLTLSYSDDPVQGTDENILRQAMHEHVLNGEIENGAEKLGKLILLRSNIFMAPEIGVNDRCLTTKNINYVLVTMTKEFKMLGGFYITFKQLSLYELNFYVKLHLFRSK